MPKGKHIIHYKQKRAAHWAARFLRLQDFVTTISTARRNFSFLWLDWIELLDSMGDAWRGTQRGLFCYIWYGPHFTLLTTRSTAERVYYPFGMAGIGLLDKASLVGLVSDLCAFSALITAIIVCIVAF